MGSAITIRSRIQESARDWRGGHWSVVTRMTRSDITLGYGLFDVGGLLFLFSALGPRAKREVVDTSGFGLGTTICT